MKGLESEKLNFLILPTNLSSHDDDCTHRLLKELVPKKEVQPLSSSSIALVPRKELMIKDQWTRQFGEEVETLGVSTIT